jgi:hypothetical protein
MMETRLRNVGSLPDIDCAVSREYCVISNGVMFDILTRFLQYRLKKRMTDSTQHTAHIITLFYKKVINYLRVVTLEVNTGSY